MLALFLSNTYVKCQFLHLDDKDIDKNSSHDMIRMYKEVIRCRRLL